MTDETREDTLDILGRRSAPRIRVDYDLQVDIEGEHVPYTGLIKDISSGGVFITTDKRHKVGDEIRLRFTFPSLNDPVEAIAVVRWVRDQYAEGGLQPGVGVQFQQLTPEITKRINDYIKDKDVPFYEEGF